MEGRTFVLLAVQLAPDGGALRVPHQELLGLCSTRMHHAPMPTAFLRCALVDEIPADDTGWGFILFPNPAHDEFFLRLTDDAPKDIALYDLTGRRVFSLNKVVGFTHSVPVSQLARGAYYVSVSEGFRSKTKKLIIH